MELHLYGHRGAKGEAKESSLAGFAHLRRLGINRVELDVRLADHHLIILHDPTIDRTAPPNSNATGSFKQYTIQQLREMGIPTLRDALAEWRDLKSIQLEIKTDTEQHTTKQTTTEQTATEEKRESKPQKEDESYCRAVAIELNKIITEFELEKRAIVTSLDRDFLRISKDKMPHIAHGIVVNESSDPHEALSKAIELNCNYFIPHHRLVIPSLVEQVKRANIHISTWTVNDTDTTDKLRSMGVSSIITDYPAKMMDHYYNLEHS